MGFFLSSNFTPQSVPLNRRPWIPVLGRIFHFRKEIFMFTTAFITNQQPCPFGAVQLRKSSRRHPYHHSNPSLEAGHAHPA